MKERIVQIRKTNNLSQAKFAEKLKLSRNFIGLVESGDRNLSDRSISDICREFGINETWLRTGEGEMSAPLSREQEIASLAVDMFNNDDAFKTTLLKLIIQMDEKQMQLLKDMALKLAETSKNE